MDGGGEIARRWSARRARRAAPTPQVCPECDPKVNEGWSAGKEFCIFCARSSDQCGGNGHLECTGALGVPRRMVNGVSIPMCCSSKMDGQKNLAEIICFECTPPTVRRVSEVEGAPFEGPNCNPTFWHNLFAASRMETINSHC